MGLLGFSTYPSVKLEDIATKCEKAGIDAVAPPDALEFDFVIVGGGTAGCVLANRLCVGRPLAKVLLLERGQVADSFVSRTPLLSLGFARSDDGVMKYESAAQVHLSDQRKMQMISGKLLGGTSRINNALYSRGHPGEYDEWGEGWTYDELDPLFNRSERDVGKQNTTDKIGEWSTRSVPPFFPATQVFIDTVKAMGVPYVEDINDPKHPASAITKLRTTVSDDGKRCSTFESFLPEKFVKQHPNLKVCVGAVVQRLDITTTDGVTKVQGIFVEGEKPSGKTFYVRGKEVILCGGAVASPQLLLLSGVGGQEQLSKHGIITKVDLPGVGKHLQDHISVPLCYRVPVASSIHVLQARPFTALKSTLQYLFNGTGLFLSTIGEQSYFLRSDRYPPGDLSPSENSSRRQENLPDLEFDWIGAWGTYEEPMPKLEKQHAFNTLLVEAIHPASTGSVTLIDRDARTPPLVDPNYLDAEEDFIVLRKGVEHGLDIGRRMMATGYDIKESLVPKGSEGIDEFIRRYASGAYHLSSTCRMAKREDGGVVDWELRVYGVEGLRVADASIFPRLVRVKPQAPIVMVAEKCADLILGTGEK